MPETALTKIEEQFHGTIKRFMRDTPSHRDLLAGHIAEQYKLSAELIDKWLEGHDFPDTTTRTRIINFTINHYCYCDRDCKQSTKPK